MLPSNLTHFSRFGSFVCQIHNRVCMCFYGLQNHGTDQNHVATACGHSCTARGKSWCSNKHGHKVTFFKLTALLLCADWLLQQPDHCWPGGAAPQGHHLHFGWGLPNCRKSHWHGLLGQHGHQTGPAPPLHLPQGETQRLHLFSSCDLTFAAG